MRKVPEGSNEFKAPNCSPLNNLFVHSPLPSYIKLCLKTLRSLIQAVLTNAERLSLNYLKSLSHIGLHWSNKKLIFSSLFIILSSSCSFGLWFKIKQISITSKKIIGLYPWTWYAVSSLKTLFIFCVLWLGLALLKSKIRDDLNRTTSTRNLFLCSLPFSAFFLSYV